MIYDEKIWLKYYDQGVPATLEYPKVPLFTFLDESASKYPHNRALSYLGNDISYSKLDRLVNKAANALTDLGVQKGDRVALYLANTPQFIIMLYGILKIGAIAVPINPLFKSAEVAYELNDSGAKSVIVMSRFYPIIQAIKEETVLKNIIVTNVKEYFPLFTRTLFTLLREKEDRVSIDATDYWLEELMQQSSDKRTDTGVEPEDIALLQYTSGTTGTPKGVMLSHYNLVVNALQCRAWVTDTVEGQERVLGWLPFFHSFGMTACLSYTMSCAGTLVLTPNPRDLAYILKTMEKEQITIMPGVPTMYAALGNYKSVAKYDLSSVRACICGGAPLIESVKKRFVEVTGSKLVEGYGLSEASPVTHANPMNGLNKPNSIGIPMPDTECKIVDLEKGREEMEVGKEGELIIKGPQMMKGYWKQTEMTNEAIREGWLYTGDIVKMDEEGYFYVVDRKKDIIIVKGLNVSPTEVEKVCFTHPKVEDAAVVGIPHEYKGEEIKAFIVLKSDQEAEGYEIIEYLREHLARFKIPSSVEFVDALPKNVMGKVMRRLLREREMKKNTEG
ncbi:long-chain fatty acid--CoA ligase [Sulfurovum sp. XGS-02]|uniref:long-chain-fatty-acid--CoA ligase n=1 Tax=Sulfurovum sp. XGS-02 TaxID=2925411 RepID=UPI00206CBA7E|nr:long-chain fatty acid--CoA ligase [Sulfurovum sp. XGS-02]UPT76658.1 long-chain fatty acid--CoA ligase [Sulfurovum sp. XGS-02]